MDTVESMLEVILVVEGLIVATIGTCSASLVLFDSSCVAFACALAASNILFLLLRCFVRLFP